MHAGGGTDYRGEKRNVLIVSVLLLIGSNLTLRSNMQGPAGNFFKFFFLLHKLNEPVPPRGDYVAWQ